MYEAKYSKYIFHSNSRFATKEEIKNVCSRISKNGINQGCGPVLFADAENLYVDSTDCHFYIEGGTGSKKTRTEAINIVNSCINAGEQVIINDPKGEIYKYTANIAKSKEYNVKVLNFRNYEFSDSWNPLLLAKLYNESGKEVQALETIDDVKDAIKAPLAELTVDRYWSDMAGEVFKYSALLLLDSVPENTFNIANIIQIGGEDNTPILKELMMNMDKTSCAYLSMRGIVDLKAEKTSSCIFSTVQQMYLPFIRNRALLELLSGNTIQFKDLIDKKTIIYVILPDEKPGYNFLVNLFYSQCYQYLIDYSTRYADGRLNKRINFVWDEFGNLPPMENFQNRISESRSHSIRFFLFGQNFGQLKKNYRENAQTILDNCEWIVFCSKDIELFDLISEMAGTEMDGYGKEKPLINACDLLHLKKYQDGAEAVIIKSGMFPFVTKIPDFEYINIFPKAFPASFEKRKTTQKPIFISFNQWLNGLGTKYRSPFS